MTIKEYDKAYYFNITDNEHSISPNDTLSYFWYSNNKINRNQGGFEGRLLSDAYSVRNRNDDLIIKGAFKKGLKHGLWNEWDEQGLLKSSYKFHKGLLNGESRTYKDNKLTEELNHCRGVKHGKQSTFKKDGTVSIEMFRYGQPVQKPLKIERIKELKPKEKNGEDGNKFSLKKIFSKDKPKSAEQVNDLSKVGADKSSKTKKTKPDKKSVDKRHTRKKRSEKKEGTVQSVKEKKVKKEKREKNKKND